jgi:hypothetical protein
MSLSNYATIVLDQASSQLRHVAPRHTFQNLGSAASGNVSLSNLLAPTSHTTVMTITNGNVGIGTTMPTNQLHVFNNDDSGQRLALFTNNNAGTNSRAEISVNSDIGGVVLSASSSEWTGSDIFGASNGVALWTGATSSGGIAISARHPSGNIRFYAGNTHRMRIAADGNVGIGTITPLAKTHIYHTTTGDIFRVDDVSADTTPFIIKDDGSVGIGTDSPLFRLDAQATGTPTRIYNTTSLSNIAGSVNTIAEFWAINGNTTKLRVQEVRKSAGTDWTSATTRIQKVTDNTNQAYIDFGTLSNAGLAFGSGTSENITMLANGNVGIGVINPQARLDIISPNVTTPSIASIRSQSTIFVRGFFHGSDGLGIGLFSPDGNGNNPTAFIQSTWDGNSARNLVLNPLGGDVGIGTTNPQAPLHIATSSGTNAIARIDASAGTGQAGLQIMAGGGGVNRAARIDFFNAITSTSVPQWTLINDYDQNATNDLRIVNNIGITTPLVITQGGNVGIGTSTPLARTHIYHTGTGDVLRVDDETAPDTTPFIINQNGNVGIGSTQPSSKLDVANSGNVSMTVQRLEGGNIEFGVANTAGQYSGSAGAGDAVIRTPSTQKLNLQSGSGNASITINTNSYVGIGTTDPLETFHVRGAQRVSNGDLSVQGQISCQNGNFLTIESFGSSISSRLPVAINPSGGNVGIGTTNPVFPLSVHYTGNEVNNYGLEISNKTASGGGNRYNLILFTDENSTQGAMGAWRQSYNGSYLSGLSFLTGSQPSGFFAARPGSSANATSSLREAMRIEPNGTVRFNIYTTNGTVSTVNGNGTLSVSSDQRIKTNVQYLEPGSNVDKVLALKPATFEYKEDPGTKYLGFIAQDVETVIPEAVDGKKYEYEMVRDSDGNVVTDVDGKPVLDMERPRYRGLSYNAIVATAVAAIQDLKNENETLRAEILAIKQHLNM